LKDKVLPFSERQY